MIKPDSLRAHITAAVPQLQSNPEQLQIFIDAGSIVSTGAAGLSFEYRYTLTMILTDFAAHPDAIMVPLLAWLAVHQIDLLQNFDKHGAIAFDAELVANDLIDLRIKIPLTESVGVHANEAGDGYNVEHYPEPLLEPNLAGGHWRLYCKGELLAEWDTPAA
ncbi:phage tail protein [Lysobacter sp. TAF61]|uniref:phage tail protein n=1 Tax=Lysobacter sp. TAF61 TaxID=3233072 RepID=UPI003F96FB93